ncbi:GIY-YIG nuclease family protein [Streptomyces lusitanus]|uniref:GIY-YIG nuclease family protein n=1 Tax=Streptomyces TaxID=1883 RepID=UPI0021BE21AA|nr:GIY-YIG nuclease family protein [Streptomyces lusitanus]
MLLENHAEFKLSITKALGDQLAAALEELTPAPLATGNILRLRPLPGVYQLYKGEELVYVGKADKSLPQRIEKHFRKISGRRNISIEEMSFTCLYVDEDFGAVAPERLLINKHRGQGEVPWNYNGFGNNDPGKRRDTTVVEEKHFDRQYPIDLAYALPDFMTVDDGSEDEWTLGKLLTTVKALLPYVFRYESTKAFDEIGVQLPTGSLTADEALRVISEHVPAPWQVTALPGYVIMYGKTEDYPSGMRYYRAGQVIDPAPDA